MDQRSPKGPIRSFVAGCIDVIVKQGLEVIAIRLESIAIRLIEVIGELSKTEGLLTVDNNTQ